MMRWNTAATKPKRRGTAGYKLVLAFATSLMVLASTVMGCSDKTVYERAVVLSGKVQSGTTGVPLDSAWVTLGDTLVSVRTRYTDSLGEFSVPSFPFRLPEQLTIKREGFRTVIDTFENVQSDVSDLLYELEPE